MTTSSLNLDRAAIGLSLLCAVHCLFLPVLIVLTPALAGTFLGQESFHQWMLVAVLPTSLIALTLGCRRHDAKPVLALGSVGLCILVFAALFGHDLFGEVGEKLVTLIGASVVAISHVWNQSLCRGADCSH